MYYILHVHNHKYDYHTLPGQEPLWPKLCMYFRSGQILKSVSGIASVDAKKVIHLLQDIIKAKIYTTEEFLLHF